MEWIALDAGAFHRGIEEPEVKGRVVTHEDRAPAAMRADGGAHFTKHRLQCHLFVNCRPQRVPGIDAVDLQ